jgi:hypothetical protein
MKIFPKDSRATISADSGKKASSKGITRKKPEAPVKKEMSPDAIKLKIAENEAKTKSADKVELTSKKLGDTFLNEEVVKKAPIMVKADIIAEKEKMVEEGKSPNTKDFIIKSDVQLNDPKDTNTQEKLKTVLAKGAFSFNPKEREALDKILQST